MRVLVAIANYGTKNQVYLGQLLKEYRSLPYRVDVVVLSNVPKDLGPGVEVRVGLPSKDPWSLPFGHKQLFADRLESYDLFIYSEDDVLIGRRQIEAFLDVTRFLPEDQIAGFLRYEESEGRRYCPEIHAYCHWVPGSVRRFGPYVFAYLTNEHAACYILNRAQLRRALASGGFLVPPHRAFYDLLCTAATDPYTQCGFTKVLCTTRIEDFLVHHLPDNYIGKLGLPFEHVQAQIKALDHCLEGQETTEELLPAPPARPATWRWSKSYHEPVRNEVLALVPKTAQQVLSIGCGAGLTEGVLAQKGIRVTAIPLDAVVAEMTRTQGLELLPPNFEKAFSVLRGRQFDCILLLDVLPYVQDPQRLLTQSGPLLAEGGRLVVTAPNFGFFRYGAMNAATPFFGHRTTPRLIAAWLQRSGLRVEDVRYHETLRFRWLVKVFPRLVGPRLSRSVILTAHPRL